MEIPRKGCNTNRSLSPETMQLAVAESASERNLLSFGSLQTLTFSVTCINKLLFSNSLTASNLASKEMYLSHFARVKLISY